MYSLGQCRKKMSRVFWKIRARVTRENSVHWDSAARKCLEYTGTLEVEFQEKMCSLGQCRKKMSRVFWKIRGRVTRENSVH